jgi:predicted lipoprotein with Yx(FWY)xxD motif
MAVQLSFTPLRVFSSNATLEPGAVAYFYQSNTTTAVAVYSDEALTIPHGSSLTANAQGVFAQAFHSGTPALKCVITDADGSTLYTVDPVRSSSTSSDAATISFTPISGNASTNVQDAIETNNGIAIANKQIAENAVRVQTTGGTGNDYTIVSANTIAAYAANQVFQFVVDRANTAAVTLDVDSLGPKAVKRYNNSVTLAQLVADDLREGEVHRVLYDGTDFVLLTPVGAKVGGVRGIVEKATTAEAEAGTADDKFPDVVKVKEAVAAHTPVKARATVDGTEATPAAFGALNVASVTDNGTGDYSIVFTDDMADTNYQVAVSIVGNGHSTDLRAFHTVARAVGSVRVRFVNVSNVATDYDFTIIVTGTLA